MGHEAVEFIVPAEIGVAVVRLRRHGGAGEPRQPLHGVMRLKPSFAQALRVDAAERSPGRRYRHGERSLWRDPPDGARIDGPAMLSSVTTPCYTRTEVSAAIVASFAGFPGTETPRGRAMADLETWIDIGSLEELSAAPLQRVRGKGRTSRLVHRRPNRRGFDLCNHVGGPLGEGDLEAIYRLPWHYWKFHRCTGAGEPGSRPTACRLPGQGEGGRVLVNLAGASKRNRRAHTPSAGASDRARRRAIAARRRFNDGDG